MNNEYRWLTDLSRQFLERDYLVDGQSVEEKVEVICNTAERILKKPGFAEAFKDNLKKGWYSLSSPIWSNFGTARGLPISCVIGETWINTKINGGKQAKDISVGDEVLTHNGRYRKITKVIKTEKRNDIYKIKISNRMTNLYLTGDHLVLTNLGWVRVDELDMDIHLVAINKNIEFKEDNFKIDLKPFCKYDYLVKDGRIHKRGAKTVREDRQVEIVNYYASPLENIYFDEEVAWALGLWFAEGSVSTNRKLPNGARITVNIEDEKQHGDKWLEIMRRRFGVNGNACESEVERKDGQINRWYTVNVNSILIGEFFRSFGTNCKDKVIPSWIIDAPKNILAKFLDAFLLGDGTVRKGGTIKCTLSNPQLILQIYQIGLKLRLDMSLQMQEKAGKLSSTKHVYTVIFRRMKLGFNRFTGDNAVAFNDGLYYAKIRMLEKTNNIKTVYDFTVDEDHSFSAAGVILHNCFGSYICDSMESILYTHAEVGMMTKHGGGTSAYFGNLRGRGESIRQNGQSSGSVHFMSMFENLIKVVSQGSCYIENTEVLTNKGFKDFRKVNKDDKIAQVDEFNFVTFTDNYELVVNDFDGLLKCFKGRKKEDSVALKVTPNHRMVISKRKMCNRRKHWSEATEIIKAENLKLHRDNRLFFSGYAPYGERLSLKDILRIAYQADGVKDGKNRKIIFHFSKKRKIERLQWILNSLKIPFKYYVEADKTTRITFDYLEEIKKEKFEDWIKLDKISCEWADGFINELQYWDGALSRHTICYYSTVRSNIDVVQAIASLCGKQTRVRIRKSYGNRKELYKIGISNKQYKSGESVIIYDEYYKGKVYCAVVPKGRLIVRYKDRTMICGNTRRGNFAAYLPIDHKDIIEFIGIRNEGHMIQDLSFGVCVSDAWMQSMIDGDKEKRVIWAKVLESRANKGYPYIFFTDNVNNNTVDCYKDKGMQITHSNLCAEIFLPDSEDESFVCDLSSMNILYFDEWKDTDAVEILTYFLDAVMTEFIEKGKKVEFMSRPVRFAERHRALGIGWLGYHSYLQSKMIPFESMEAKYANTTIAKNIKEAAYKASAKLAQEYGEPEVLKGYGRRNSTLLAIAPTKSSAFIMGQVSENTEPNRTNIVIKDLQKGKYTMKNIYLEQLLESKGKNDESTWSNILKNGGSVQHLDFLTKHEKDVFKTFAEISPKEIIIQAAQCQKYIDQGQSINLMIHPSIPIKDVNALYIEAWKMGILSLYYQYSVNAAQNFAREILLCASCQS